MMVVTTPWEYIHTCAVFIYRSIAFFIHCTITHQYLFWAANELNVYNCVTSGNKCLSERVSHWNRERERGGRQQSNCKWLRLVAVPHVCPMTGLSLWLRHLVMETILQPPRRVRTLAIYTLDQVALNVRREDFGEHAFYYGTIVICPRGRRILSKPA